MAGSIAVRILAPIPGTTYRVDDVVVVPKAQAREWIARGLAEPYHRAGVKVLHAPPARPRTKRTREQK